MRPVSVSTALFDGYPIEQAFAEIAASGARCIEPAYIRGYVEFDETAFARDNARLIAGLATREKLSVIAVSAHLDMALPEAVPMLRRRIEFAAEIGADHVITNTGQVTSRSAIMHALGAVLPDCAATGVGLALENPGHGSGDLIGCGADGVALINAIGSPWVRLNYDVGNVYTYNREAVRPETDIPTALGRIAHAHLKDVRTDGEDWKFTAIGDGVIDYRQVLAALPEEIPVGIELPLRLDRRGRGDPVRRSERVALPVIRDAIAKSLAFVRSFDVLA